MGLAHAVRRHGGTAEGRPAADRTNNRSKRDGCEVRLIDGALGGSLRRRPLSPLRMWRWTLDETVVTCVRSMTSGGRFYGSRPGIRAAGCSVLSEVLAWVVVAASRARTCSMIVAMTSGFSMRAMTRSLPPHLGRVSMSMAKTRFRRRIRHGGKGHPAFRRFAFCHDGLTMLAIRREHAVEPGEVQSRTRDQRRQAGDEVEWVEDDVGGAVANGCLNR